MWTWFKGTLAVLLFYLMRVFPVRKNKIVFSSFMGKGYGGNCKYITEALLDADQEQALDLVWLSADASAAMPARVRKISRRSIRSIYELCTAKVWVDNQRKPGYTRKRKVQFYVQTWHGNIATKKVEKDVEDLLPQTYVKAAINDSKMADVFMSGAKADTQRYREAFWYDGEVMEVGYPRQDILFRNDKEKKREIKRKLGLGEHDKVLLHAPTFRDGEKGTDLSFYDAPYEDIVNALEHRFGGNWKGMVRLHPNISQLSGKLKLPASIQDVSGYDDMQELILICDCLISDYSSAIVEAGAVKKTGFLFVKDYDLYQKERAAYFKLEDMPFPVAKTEEELIQMILAFDEEKFRQDWERFYLKEYGLVPGGTASRAICERILEATRGQDREKAQSAC